MALTALSPPCHVALAGSLPNYLQSTLKVLFESGSNQDQAGTAALDTVHLIRYPL